MSVTKTIRVNDELWGHFLVTVDRIKNKRQLSSLPVSTVVAEALAAYILKHRK